MYSAEPSSLSYHTINRRGWSRGRKVSLVSNPHLTHSSTLRRWEQNKISTADLFRTGNVILVVYGFCGAKVRSSS